MGSRRDDGRRRPLGTLLILAIVLMGACTAAWAHGGGGDTSSSGGGDQRKNKTLVKVKLVCLALVFLATFLGGMSPLFCRWNHSVLLLGTQFAGGVFLATALLHFLPDSNGKFTDLLPSRDYPFAFMLSAAGYLLTMLSDCIISHIFALQIKAAPATDFHHLQPTSIQVSSFGLESATPAIPNTRSTSSKSQHDVAISVNEEAKSFLGATMLKNTNLSDTMLLILALCFHSVFEGIAIGIADNVDDAWRALWTISLHKVFAAIAMGLALLSMLPTRPMLSCFLFSFAFAISSPIGVAIGIVIEATTEGHIADWTYAIAMGLACGVFIYVAINHLLAKGFLHQEKLRCDTPFFKFFAASLGVAVICVVMNWDT